MWWLQVNLGGHVVHCLDHHIIAITWQRTLLQQENATVSCIATYYSIYTRNNSAVADQNWAFRLAHEENNIQSTWNIHKLKFYHPVHIFHRHQHANIQIMMIQSYTLLKIILSIAREWHKIITKFEVLIKQPSKCKIILQGHPYQLLHFCAEPWQILHKKQPIHVSTSKQPRINPKNSAWLAQHAG